MHKGKEEENQELTCKDVAHMISLRFSPKFGGKCTLLTYFPTMQRLWPSWKTRVVKSLRTILMDQMPITSGPEPITTNRTNI